VLSLDTFLTSFPEFANTPKGLLAAKLAESLLQIDPNIWGVKADTGQGYLAAHLITLSPMGQNARMIVASKNGTQPTTTYMGHYRVMQQQVSSGYRVASSGPAWPYCGW
jgi:Protein of unknown function (DUF4054)